MSKDGNGETTIYYYRDNPRLIKERDDLAAKLEVAIEALKHYSEETPYREVINKMNFCIDECPKDCHEHTIETKGKARSAGPFHGPKIAREALKKLGGEGEG